MPLWSQITITLAIVLMIIAVIVWVQDARDKKPNKESNNLAVPKNAIEYLKTWCKENGYSMSHSVDKDGWELEKKTKINTTIIYVVRLPRFTEITTDYEYVVEGKIVNGTITQPKLNELRDLCLKLEETINKKDGVEK